MIYLTNIPDKNKKELIRLRFRKEEYFFYDSEIQDIKIEGETDDGFCAIVTLENKRPMRYCMVYEKFYLKEIDYLIKENLLIIK